MFVVHRPRLITQLIASVFVVYCLILHVEADSKRKLSCFQGHFDQSAGICVCSKGWFGNQCQFQRQRLTATKGVIIDHPNKNGQSKECLWLIEATRANSTIHLNVEQFWSSSPLYTLYIYNGSSFKQPLLASYSGTNRLNCTRQSNSWITTTSALVLIYFFRDSSNINSGFKLNYRIINNCSWSCYNHGYNHDSENCWCEPGRGSKPCPYQCVYGTCNVTTQRCDCHSGYHGHLCNSSSQNGAWTNHIPVNHDLVQSNVASGAGVIGSWLWIYGGRSFTHTPRNQFVRYNFLSNLWETVTISNTSLEEPDVKYGHSLSVYNRLLIIFGGITSKDSTSSILWCFNTTSRMWSRFPVEGHKPLGVVGHTATIVDTKLVVIFGYGPLYGFTKAVQIYDLVSNTWTIQNHTTKQGTYGHSSHYDPVTHLIYVHGGRLKTGPIDALYSYDVNNNHWTYLSGSKAPRFLHSSGLIGNIIVVFGGKILTDDKRKNCPDTQLMLYDITCNKWTTVPGGSIVPIFGQSSIVYDSQLYFFGGYDGTIKKNMISYSLGECSHWKNKSSCTSAYRLSGCLWDPSIKKCIGPREGYPRLNILEQPSCQAECSSISTCGACNAPGLECQWCDDTCKKKSEVCIGIKVKMCKYSSLCKVDAVDECVTKEPICQPHQKCSKYCHKCLGMAGSNVWCPSQRKCISQDSYQAMYPIEHCNTWLHGSCRVNDCSSLKSCATCLSVSKCVWCEKGASNGHGFCKEGGLTGDSLSRYIPGRMQCPRWHFIECPVCQCNGHSECRSGTSVCVKCSNNTAGKNCEKCIKGYYGNPRNGGTCKECDCNGHAKQCHQQTSKCDCLVQGITGDKCEKCDEEYEGNATNGKLCYYKLESKHRKTFNVTGKENLNIKFSPSNTDQDINFEIKILRGQRARINMSYTQDPSKFYSNQKAILNEREVNLKFSYKLNHRTFHFRDRTVVFQANIYELDARSSFKIEVYYDQKSTLNINLLEFFLTFFGCFLSLLLLASVGWKIRSRYHSYLLRRQRRAEREKMANRPFSTVNLLLPSDLDVLNKSSATPVAMEPLAKNKVAVTSVIVLLPADEEGVTPVGQCGVCFGSMLMSHGNHQHNCIRSRMGHKKPKKRATMTTYHL